MAVTQWRKCTFFNQEVVKGPSGAAAWDLPRELDVTCCASGHAQLVFGDAEGGVTLVSRALEATTFSAYSSRVTHVAALKQQGILGAWGSNISLSRSFVPGGFISQGRNPQSPIPYAPNLVCP